MHMMRLFGLWYETKALKAESKMKARYLTVAITTAPRAILGMVGSGFPAAAAAAASASASAAAVDLKGGIAVLEV